MTVTSNSLSIALFSLIFDKHYAYEDTNNIITKHNINNEENRGTKAVTREKLDVTFDYITANLALYISTRSKNQNHR